MELNFLNSAKELRSWLKKNHNKEELLNIGIYKKIFSKTSLTMPEVAEEALCFGWHITRLKKIDHFTYHIIIKKRKLNGVWSLNTIKAYKNLKKQGRIQKPGAIAFESRNKKKSEEKPRVFSPKELKIFKANKTAWEFFQKQPQGYKGYVTWWVVSAVRPETKEKRLNEVIQDSSEGTRLKRMLAAEQKYAQKKYPPGKTPIEAGKNLGDVSGMELRSVGIDTVEKLRSIGWEKALEKLSLNYPQRLTLNMALSLMGAIEDQKRQKLDSHQRAEAKSFLREILSQF